MTTSSHKHNIHQLVSKLMNTEYFSEYRSLISKTKYKNDSVKKPSTQEFLEILFLEILS